MSRVQSFAEDVSDDLYGRNGDVGIVREHQADRTAKEEHEKSNRRTVVVVGLLGTVVPLTIKVLELLHFIPK